VQRYSNLGPSKEKHDTQEECSKQWCEYGFLFY